MNLFLILENVFLDKMDFFKVIDFYIKNDFVISKSFRPFDIKNDLISKIQLVISNISQKY